MEFVKLKQDFYRTTAYVIAEIVNPDKTIAIYDGELIFRMQPDMGIQPQLPLQVFCRSWKKDQAIGLISGKSDQVESLRTAIISFIKRIHRRHLTVDSVITLDVEIVEVTEQEAFEMNDLSNDFMNAVIRFYFERSRV